jgi:hypothetical protein
VLHLGEDLGAQGEVEGGEERGCHSLSHIRRNSYWPLYQCNASQRHTISCPVPSMTATVSSVSSIFWPSSIDKPTEEVIATNPSLPLAPSPSPHENCLAEGWRRRPNCRKVSRVLPMLWVSRGIGQSASQAVLPPQG